MVIEEKLMEESIDTEMDMGVEAKEHNQQLMVQFTSETGETPYASFSIPKNVTPAKLKTLLLAFRKQLNEVNGED